MKYRVTRHVMIEQIYDVEADDPKQAEAKTCDVEPVKESELYGETMLIRPAPPQSAEPK